MKQKYLIILLIIFTSSGYIGAQEMITIGQKFKIFSYILGEEREYYLYLPDSYGSNNKKYPVIYSLDAEKNFIVPVSIQKMLGSGKGKKMPESIIVGIVNTDRARDLTPSFITDKHHDQDIFKTSGGSEKFTKFIMEELKSHIDSLYLTSDLNTILGHSLGGLFVINTLVHHPDYFDNYIALEPSLWWDKKKVSNEASDIFDKSDYTNKYLFIALAGDKENKEKDKQYSAILDFATNILPLAASRGLSAKWKCYDNENHGGVIIPGTYDAFNYIFGYR